MFIKFHDIRVHAEDIQNLRVVGHYSLDGKKRYTDDLSQLKYYIPPKNPFQVRFDLDKDCDLRVIKSEDNTKLDHMLRWMSDHLDDIKIKEKTSTTNRWLQPEIVCFRGVLTKFLATPYEKDGWIICAVKFEGTIYICAFDTDEVKERKSNSSEYEKKCTAWGHKFEQYMLADHPRATPNTSVPVNENEEFCCIFQCSFGNTLLLYGAEMDGVCSKEPFTDTLVDKDVEFVELKTINASALGRLGPLPNRALTALKWWGQSYLVGIKRIICGSKQSKIVKRLQEFHIEKFTSNSGYDWSDELCKSFCIGFLRKLKAIVHQDYDKCLYKFTWNAGGDEIEVEELKPVPECEYNFLTPEYIAEVKRHKSRCE